MDLLPTHLALWRKTWDYFKADICQQRHTKSVDFYKEMQDIQQGLLQTKLLQWKKHFDLCKIVLQHNFTQFKVLIGMLFKALDFCEIKKKFVLPFCGWHIFAKIPVHADHPVLRFVKR